MWLVTNPLGLKPEERRRKLFDAPHQEPRAGCLYRQSRVFTGDLQNPEYSIR